MTTYAKGIPNVEWPLSAILKETSLSVKSDETIDTTAVSFTLFRVPANTFIEGIRVQVNTAFTTTDMVMAPTVLFGDTPGGRQFGVISSALQDTGLANPVLHVGAEYDTPIYVYATVKTAAALAGEAEVWLIYRPNSNESPWAK
jgi:hypothetical protein